MHIHIHIHMYMCTSIYICVYTYVWDRIRAKGLGLRDWVRVELREGIRLYCQGGVLSRVEERDPVVWSRVED